MGEKGFYERSSRSDAQADDVSSRSQKDRGVSTGEMGEGEGAAEEGGVVVASLTRNQQLGSRRDLSDLIQLTIHCDRAGFGGGLFDLTSYDSYEFWGVLFCSQDFLAEDPSITGQSTRC